MNFKKSSKVKNGKRWSRRYARKKALRVSINDTSATRDSFSASHRGWGIGIGR